MRTFQSNVSIRLTYMIYMYRIPNKGTNLLTVLLYQRQVVAKHETLTQCCLKVVPAFTTLAQLTVSIRSMGWLCIRNSKTISRSRVIYIVHRFAFYVVRYIEHQHGRQIMITIYSLLHVNYIRFARYIIHI